MIKRQLRSEDFGLVKNEKGSQNMRNTLKGDYM